MHILGDAPFSIPKDTVDSTTLDGVPPVARDRGLGRAVRRMLLRDSCTEYDRRRSDSNISRAGGPIHGGSDEGSFARGRADLDCKVGRDGRGPTDGSRDTRHGRVGSDRQAGSTGRRHRRDGWTGGRVRSKRRGHVLRRQPVGLVTLDAFHDGRRRTESGCLRGRSGA